MTTKRSTPNLHILNDDNQAAAEHTYDLIIVGAGPIGLAIALEAQAAGLDYLVIEAGSVTHSIYQYPLSMKFFSTPELLEIGDVPFITETEKPTRGEALKYYRLVAQRRKLNMHLYERVQRLTGTDGDFQVQTERWQYRCRKVALAIGAFHKPRPLSVPGEDLPKVRHYFTEPHEYAWQRVMVVGSGNSAAEAALECWRAGAEVTLVLRSRDFHKGLKYWVRPDIENRIRKGEIKALFSTEVQEIKPTHVALRRTESSTDTELHELEVLNDFVLAMTGYLPDYELLARFNVDITDDHELAPIVHPDTLEADSQPGVYLAGVVLGGTRTDKWFIENSRVHATQIVHHITAQHPS